MQRALSEAQDSEMTRLTLGHTLAVSLVAKAREEKRRERRTDRQRLPGSARVGD